MTERFIELTNKEIKIYEQKIMEFDIDEINKIKYTFYEYEGAK